MTLPVLLASFLLFRFFDIAKGFQRLSLNGFRTAPVSSWTISWPEFVPWLPCG
jgi:hypothetical protein